ETDDGTGGIVDIRAPLTTLLGLTEDPGEIPGWGPVIADITRQIVANSHDSEWRIAVTHHNQLLDVITTRRRPTKSQQRLVEALDPECVFPTCRIDSADCDIDHTLPWTQTHHTTVSELEPLCRYHHQQKHDNWTLKQIRPGNYQWTSPLGHTYTTGPDPP
ncbi:MAG TPA: HNH endonuclease signature motif containing protein, partial [Acidimicrobiia bacterium]|nr:HNH endonuclease signature motif containing protein [Acidimicrobiia bacterium]